MFLFLLSLVVEKILLIFFYSNKTQKFYKTLESKVTLGFFVLIYVRDLTQ